MFAVVTFGGGFGRLSLRSSVFFDSSLSEIRRVLTFGGGILTFGGEAIFFKNPSSS